MNITDYQYYTFWEMIKELNMKKLSVKCNSDAEWYISDGNSHYLHKDLKIYSDTGWLNPMGASGYYKSERHAKLYLRAYLNKEKNQMRFIIRQKNCKRGHSKRGWYIRALKDDRYVAWFVWRDLELHIDADYYNCKKLAEDYLRLFKEKHNMADRIEIDVKVNGKDVPLHEISEQTLLTVRENSKPKEIPVARVAEANGYRYLLLKVPSCIEKHKGKVIAINLKGGYINGSWTLEHEQKQQNDKTYPDCIFSYINAKTIS